MTTSAGPPFRDGDLLWRERMSPSTRVLGALGLVLGLLVVALGIARSVPPTGTAAGPMYVVVGLAMAWFSVVGSLLPVLEARSTGVYVRNVLHETWVPWSAVVTIVPNARLNVILDGGAFVGVWAVQPGAGRGLGRRSRVEVVAERLTDAWPESRGRTGSTTAVRRVAGPWPRR